jgi:hypothetical protein
MKSNLKLLVVVSALAITSIGLSDFQAQTNSQAAQTLPQPQLFASGIVSTDTSPAFSGDGSAMVFYSNRPGGYGKGDLYVSFKRNHRWTPAANLGAIVNTAESEYNPVISPDGKTLYFGKNGNIYWIPVADLKIDGLGAKHLRR